MADVTSATKMFPTAKEGFTTTLASTISSGAATVPLNSVTGFSNGETVVLVIEPTDANKKQAFTGVVDTSGVQITNVVWTEGTNSGHTAGVTVVDYETATHWALFSKGLLRDHNQSGYHKTLKADDGSEWIKQAATASAVNEVTIANAATGTGPTISATGDDTNIDLNLAAKGTGQVKFKSFNDGWVYNALPAVSSVAANGNRSYNVTFNSSVASTLTPGMRVRATRTVAAPTQCADLESGSSQYFSKTSPAGLSFTDDWTASAWIKLESYGAVSGIIGRRNADTEGWSMSINASGQLVAWSGRIAANNSETTSYQSVPLGKWTHVAVTTDLSGTSVLTYIDGVLVPSSTVINGTITALVQGTTALVVGSNKSAGTNPFDGKIAQAAVFSSVLSAATIASYMSQILSGSESTNVSAFSLNGVLTDLNANANNLTANGSAVATNADSPFSQDANGVIGSYDYGIVTKVATTVATIQVPEGCAIPTSGGVSAVDLAPAGVPFGFPKSKNRWRVATLHRVNVNVTSNATYGSFNGGGNQLVVPVGEWTVGHQYGILNNSTTTAVYYNISPTALTGLTNSTGYDASPFAIKTLSSAAAETDTSANISAPVSVTTAQTWVLYTLGATTNAGPQGAQGRQEIYAEFDLL